MYIVVQSMPALIPWSVAKNRPMPKLAPPPKMREIWIGQEFSADYDVVGFYCFCNPTARLQEMTPDENSRKVLSNQELLYYSSGGKEMVLYLSYEEGMKIIEQATDSDLIINWYKKYWPKNCEFTFMEDEVDVTEDEIVETRVEHGRP